MKIKRKEKIRVEVGDQFVCIKTVKMLLTGEKVYRKGFMYVSENDKCITNHLGNKHHQWPGGKLFKQSFLYIKGYNIK